MELTRLQLKGNISLPISQPKYLEIPASRAEKPGKGKKGQIFHLEVKKIQQKIKNIAKCAKKP